MAENTFKGTDNKTYTYGSKEASAYLTQSPDKIFGSSSKSTTPAPASGGSSDAFLSELQNSLKSAAGAVSSFDTQIEQGIAGAIAGTKRATELGSQRIESAFSREQGYTADAGRNKAVAANEARRGFATSTGILKQIYQDTDKSIKDLEQRKQELIMQGEAAGASAISELQLKELTFKQEAAQKTYSNLLQMANFGLGVKAEERLSKGQLFQEKQALSSIALQFGLSVDPGDTIESMTLKAAPLASEEQRLKLAQMTASIRESEARISKMYQEGKSANESLSSDELDILARDMFQGGQLPDGVTKKEYIAIRDRMNDITDETVSELEGLASGYTNKTRFVEDMTAKGYDQRLVNEAALAVKKGPSIGSRVTDTLQKINYTVPSKGERTPIDRWLSSFNQ